MKFLTRFLLLLSAIVFSLLATGCVSNSESTESPVPWNRPASWEGKMPGIQQ